MPETRTRRRTLTAVAALALAVGFAAPVAAQLGEEQPGQWAGSSWSQPQRNGTTTSNPDIGVAGEFVLRRDGRAVSIAGASVVIVDDQTDGFDPPSACAESDTLQVPGDGGSTLEVYDTQRFAGRIPVPCNGRYVIEATAHVDGEGVEDHTMRRVITVEAPAPPVAGVEAAATGDRQVRVSWSPLTESELPPDFEGYVVERARAAGGPSSAAQTDDETSDETSDLTDVDPDETSARRAPAQEFGSYETVATVGRFDDPRITDRVDAAGTYGYRVRAARSGVDGSVLTPTALAPTTSVQVGGGSTTTTTTPDDTTPTTGSDGSPGTTAGGGSRPQIGTGTVRPTSPGRTLPTFGTPTTLDTGFEETLDYSDVLGDRDEDDSDDGLGGEELAGQSIVQDEGEGVGVLVPAAGALVLLIWAGHVVYLNRLAKEL